MDEMVAGFRNMVGSIEVVCHRVHTMESMVSSTNETIVVVAKMSEPESIVVREEGLPVARRIWALEVVSFGLLEGHLNSVNWSRGHVERIVSVSPC